MKLLKIMDVCKLEPVKESVYRRLVDLGNSSGLVKIKDVELLYAKCNYSLVKNNQISLDLFRGVVDELLASDYLIEADDGFIVRHLEKKQKDPFIISPEENRAVRMLNDICAQRYDDWKSPPSKEWQIRQAKEFRKMVVLGGVDKDGIRYPKLSFNEIYTGLTAIKNDYYPSALRWKGWGNVVLSAAKFRKQWLKIKSNLLFSEAHERGYYNSNGEWVHENNS